MYACPSPFSPSKLVKLFTSYVLPMFIHFCTSLKMRLILSVTVVSLQKAIHHLNLAHPVVFYLRSLLAVISVLFTSLLAPSVASPCIKQNPICLIPGKMDDVLDSVRFIHVHGDVHGRLSVMVPVLLRGEDSPGAMAAVAGDQGLLNTVQEVRASSALQAGTGEQPFCFM